MAGRLPTSAIAVCHVGCWAALVAGLSLTAATPAAATEVAGDGEVKRVLILQSFGSDFSPYNLFAATFRTELAELVPDPVEFTEISVVSAWGPDQSAESPLVDYLLALYGEGRPDLLVSIGGPAARFAIAHRGRLFPSTPLVLAGPDQRVIAGLELSDGDALIPAAHAPAAMVETILRVLPSTERLVVVLGRSPIERFWRAELERDLSPFADRLALLWWDELPFEEMLRRAQELPPRSAILYALFLVDSEGVPHSLLAALTELHAVANAPIFGLFDLQLGRGVVGGPLSPMEQVSRLSARVAARVLAGEPPREHRLQPVGPGSPAFDWRELRRWGIRQRDLPPGSSVLFRPPSIWQVYRWPVLGGLATIALLTVLVIGLLVHRARRHKAEREVRALSRRLLTALEEERRWLARELHDDLAQRLARLAIDAARIERGDAATGGEVDLASMRRELGVLSSDVHALSRRLHPSVLDELGLEEALRVEAESFGGRESIAVSLDLDELLGELLPDQALCLYRIAQEALNNVARHARAQRVEIRLRRSSNGCTLEIRDDGVGFNPAAPRAGPRLGHASMRERVSLVGGRVEIRSTPGGGTTVAVWAPIGGRGA